MKTSFITTVFNEEKTIDLLMETLLNQIQYPKEVIIMDGGSKDKTIEKIKEYKNKFKEKGMVFLLLEKKGNRSIGRNEAIEQSTGDIIVCADAGCRLDKNWVRNIIKPFSDNKVDVVAGYYKGEARNIFQKCIVPYVLVMPERVNPENFLPATRSMAFKKSVWEKIEGFDEKLSHNEDYDFARRIKKNNYNITFAKNAVVYWSPPNSIFKTFIMFFRFAYGDIEAKIYRPKALLVIGRYFLGSVLFVIQIYTHSLFLLILIIVLVFNYTIWAIVKNYQYVKNIRAFFYLPLIQIISDFAVIIGTMLGFLKYAL